MRLSLQCPHLVRRQIVASAAYRRDGMVDGFWDGLMTADLSSMPELYLATDRAINPDPAHQQQLFDLDTTLMRGFVDWPDVDLAAIQCPTLLVAADRDVVRVQHLAEMADLIPNARLLVVPGTHGDYLGEALASGGDLTCMRATLPWLLQFLDEPDNFDRGAVG